MASAYRFSQAMAARFMGGLLVAFGLLVFLLATVVGVLHLPVAVLSVGVVLGLVTVLLAAYLLTRRAEVVRLDDLGYRVRYVRGAGVKRGRWVDVEDVVAARVGNEPCAVLRLRDGRTTAVPVALLQGDAEEFLADLRHHLDTGHGYRRLS